ncbi:MAG: response regulator [Deltaproteobacteria bacterium]|nr:response regulator [Deltaproteobacteria bacterium]
MFDGTILKDKRILAVDDEPDILEVIREEFPESSVSVAGNFEAAMNLIQKQDFDLIILDIMGVNGLELLAQARMRGMPATMLTAHAINVDSLNRSIRLGAVSFIPKDELVRLPEYIAEILEGLEQGHTHWRNLFNRLGPFFRDRLGIVWEDLESPPSPPFLY